MTTHDLDTFVAAYIECALWSSHDMNDDYMAETLDANYSADDIAPESLAGIRQDCRDFVTSNIVDLAGLNEAQAGHDFWLTRNGHGAGFWDRGLGALGDRLSKACKPYGSVDLYVGDDGLIHGHE